MILLKTIFGLSAFIILTKGNLLIDNLRWEFLDAEEQLWQFVLTSSEEKTFLERHIIIELEKFNKKLQQMSSDAMYGINSAETKPSFALLYYDIRLVSDFFEKFKDHLQRLRYDENLRSKKHAWPDITQDILYEKNNMKEISGKLKEISHKIFYEDSFKVQKDSICNYQEAKSQLMYNLYNTISLTYLKAYVMAQFSYMVLFIYGKENYMEDGTRFRNDYESRTQLLIHYWQSKNFSSNYYKCDPQQYSEETYGKITKLLQGEIENEADLNKEGTCQNTCEDYTYTKSYGCYDYRSTFCRKRKKCNGKVLNCRFINSYLDICLSPQNSLRRYEFISPFGQNTMGKKSNCWLNSANSWDRWFFSCSYCVCLCDEQGPNSDRYFNLRPVKSNIRKNRVVTGVRLTKVNRMIHIQIQEGKLLPFGYIDEETVHWVPVEEFQITDEGVYDNSDYFTMNWEKRSLVTTDITLTTRDVITGIQFEVAGNALSFKVFATPINFENGTMHIKDTFQKNVEKIDSISYIENPDIPTESIEPNVYKNIFKHVQFTHTSFEKDAAQTTVPFFDFQPVMSRPAAPLTGFQLYYKGSEGYGGFIGPMVYPYNYKTHANVGFPPMKPRKLLRPEDNLVSK